MLPRQLAYEALSAFTGHDIKPVREFHRNNPGKPAPDHQTHHEFIHHALFSSRHDGLGGLTDVAGGGRRSTENASIRQELFVHDDFFHPRYDRDYTDIPAGPTRCRRGGEPYMKPRGWKRFALKVKDKYEDGDGWLGEGPDAWPVSYHGTSIEGAEGIIESHYRPGDGVVHGRGIYSAPNIESTNIYSQTFTSKTTKKTYRVALQNRINPQERKVIQENPLIDMPEYWLVPVPEGTPHAAEKTKVRSAIRPYGLLLKEEKTRKGKDTKK